MNERENPLENRQYPTKRRVGVVWGIIFQAA